MQFDSLTFAAFFAIVLALYALLRGNAPKKNLLLAGSYLFYMAWSPPFVLLLMATTWLDWYVARRIAASSVQSTRNFWLVTSLASNLGVLGYFKYGGFLLDNTQTLLAGAGIAWQPPGWNIVLPVGISFYTFQSMSYTIDVWRGRMRADWSLRDFALFVTFFPQLVAGPIVRASQFLPQLQRERFIRADWLARGLTLLVFGVCAKVVFADGLLAPIADRGFTPAAGTLDTWLGLFAFSGQIFFDFSAYSTCAIGAAMCLGYTLPANFRSPYAAGGFSDFWRRWHISLSRWLRDYLYISLGGNRSGNWKTWRNLFLTMLLGGLWHGAAWGFVIWGALHGLYLVIERLTLKVSVHAARFWQSLAGQLATFLLVTFAWLFFRAPTWDGFAGALLRMAGDLPSQATANDINTVLIVIGGLLAWHVATREHGAMHRFLRLSTGLRAVAIAVSIFLVILFSKGESRAFIYFQF